MSSGAAAYKMARMRETDIDVVELYDAFTVNTILFLEDLGFCPKAKAAGSSAADASGRRAAFR